jgi:Na+-driven multidrug efflux pump
MKSVLKNIACCLVVLSSVFIAAPTVLAGDYGLSDTGQAIGFKNNEQNTVGGMTRQVVTVALALLAFVFFGLMLYAGMKWMTARGNEEIITEAKDTLQAAIIGLVIVSMSYAISTFILGKLGGGQ